MSTAEKPIDILAAQQRADAVNQRQADHDRMQAMVNAAMDSHPDAQLARLLRGNGESADFARLRALPTPELTARLQQAIGDDADERDINNLLLLALVGDETGFISAFESAKRTAAFTREKRESKDATERMRAEATAARERFESEQPLVAALDYTLSAITAQGDYRAEYLQSARRCLAIAKARQ